MEIAPHQRGEEEMTMRPGGLALRSLQMCVLGRFRLGLRRSAQELDGLVVSFDASRRVATCEHLGFGPAAALAFRLTHNVP